MLVFTIGAVSAAINLVLVPHSILRLVRDQTLRTPLNYWAIGIGAVFLLVFAAWVIPGLLRVK